MCVCIYIESNRIKMKLLYVIMTIVCLVVITYRTDIIPYYYMMAVGTLFFVLSQNDNTEQFQISSEAIQNVGSIFNNENMTVKNLTVTGDLGISGTTTANMLNVSGTTTANALSVNGDMKTKNLATIGTATVDTLVVNGGSTTKTLTTTGTMTAGTVRTPSVQSDYVTVYTSGGRVSVDRLYVDKDSYLNGNVITGSNIFSKGAIVGNIIGGTNGVSKGATVNSDMSLNPNTTQRWL